MLELLTGTITPIIHELIPYLVVIIVTVVGRLAQKHFGYKVDAQKQAGLEKLAINAIYRVEEKYARKGAEKIAGKYKGWKHAETVDKFLGMVPELDKNEAEELVKNMVARLPDIGAFKR